MCVHSSTCVCVCVCVCVCMCMYIRISYSVSLLQNECLNIQVHKFTKLIQCCFHIHIKLKYKVTFRIPVASNCLLPSVRCLPYTFKLKHGSILDMFNNKWPTTNHKMSKSDPTVVSSGPLNESR